MFEVGSYYHFRMWEPGENGGGTTVEFRSKVVEVALPLIMYEQGGHLLPVTTRILNTASMLFLGAEPARNPEEWLAEIAAHAGKPV
jgi:hypothetical protein